MKSLAVKFSITFISCILVIPGVLADAPNFPGDNEHLNKATYIQDPTKSWAILLNSMKDARHNTIASTLLRAKRST